MKLITGGIVFTLVFVLTFVAALAAGDAVRGKALFDDQKFAGGSTSCNECHPNGRDLEESVSKKSMIIFGKEVKSLEAAVNYCIVNACRGKAIDIQSQEMQDIVAYIKSIQK